MEKLKKKIFLVIFLILTIFLISILFIFNYQAYNQEKKEIENNLTKMESNRNRNERFKTVEPEKEKLDEDSNNTEMKLQQLKKKLNAKRCIRSGFRQFVLRFR